MEGKAEEKLGTQVWELSKKFAEVLADDALEVAYRTWTKGFKDYMARRMVGAYPAIPRGTRGRGRAPRFSTMKLPPWQKDPDDAGDNALVHRSNKLLGQVKELVVKAHRWRTGQLTSDSLGVGCWVATVINARRAARTLYTLSGEEAVELNALLSQDLREVPEVAAEMGEPSPSGGEACCSASWVAWLEACAFWGCEEDM